MNKSQVATVYANSLLDLVGNSPELEEVEQELFAVHKAFFSDSAVRDFILSPILNRDEKEASLLKSLQGQVKEIVVSFIGILNQKGRLEYLPEITEVFSEGVDRVRGRSKVTIESKEELPEATIERIRNTLEARFHTKVLISNKILPLIGGFVIRMDDYLVDASMKSKLATIKKSLLSKKITVGAIYED
jgi:F-type H+-transporting ATPase subunit delta